jgi:hypothetical protein
LECFFFQTISPFNAGRIFHRPFTYFFVQ